MSDEVPARKPGGASAHEACEAALSRGEEWPGLPVVDLPLGNGGR
ncbi:hypothetical protein [Neoroseomonas soli]|nr:hypothetical protein [Neoroseomonas soli]